MAIQSETGALREVIVHRPGPELDRITPDTTDRFLFDELLWTDRAQDEHDAFAGELRAAGAEVLYLADLLEETLRVPAAREAVVDATLDDRIYGPVATDELRGALHDLGPAELTRTLIAGLTKGELSERSGAPHSVGMSLLRPDDFVLEPLPNHLYTRDTTAWIGDGVAVNSMNKTARVRETVHYDAIYTWHPRFASRPVPRWNDGLASGPATLEGGDVLVLDERTVLLGISERTTPQGAERVASRLLSAGAADQVVCVVVPADRSMMHLDTVLTMIDRRTFVRYGGLPDLEAFTLTRPDGAEPEPPVLPGSASGSPTAPGAGPGTPIPGGVDVLPHRPVEVVRHPAGPVERILAEALGTDGLRVLVAPLGARTSAREQWDDACNVLAVDEGIVLAYERNDGTNRFLEQHGIEVRPVVGSELGRGRGGPRCMSCPVDRAPLGATAS